MFQNDDINITEAENLAGRYLQLCKARGSIPHIDVDGIYEEFIYPEFGEFPLKYAPLNKSGSTEQIFGLTDYKHRKIVLDVSLLGEQKARRPFTLAHELRHVIDFYRNPTFKKKECSEEQLEQIELQANKFANHLIMPTVFLYEKFQEKYAGYNLLFHGPGDYRCDGKIEKSVRSAEDLNRRYAKPLAPYFSHTSTENLINRLETMGLLKRSVREEFVSTSRWERERVAGVNGFCNNLQKRHDNL
jgi:Zn-dependent peptidase ImmA (M78 family)